MSRTSVFLEAALEYAAHGWPVFPVHGFVNGRCTCGRRDCGSQGVDLRANGGYIVAPPSIHRSGARYGWLDPGREPVPAPTWLKRAERPRIEIPRVAPASFAGDGTAYGRAALKSALTSLRHAPVGQRNHTLNRCAFAMAQLIAGGELREDTARSAIMLAAHQIGLTVHESRQTIASAFNAGCNRPRSAPHRFVR